MPTSARANGALIPSSSSCHHSETQAHPRSHRTLERCLVGQSASGSASEGLWWRSIRSAEVAVVPSRPHAACCWPHGADACIGTGTQRCITRQACDGSAIPTARAPAAMHRPISGPLAASPGLCHSGSTAAVDWVSLKGPLCDARIWARSLTPPPTALLCCCAGRSRIMPTMTRRTSLLAAAVALALVASVSAQGELRRAYWHLMRSLTVFIRRDRC